MTEQALKSAFCPSPSLPAPVSVRPRPSAAPQMQLLGCAKGGGFAAAAAPQGRSRVRARRLPCPPRAGLFGDLFDFESWAPKSSQAWRLGNGTGGRRQQGGCCDAGVRRVPRVCHARAWHLELQGPQPARPVVVVPLAPVCP